MASSSTVVPSQGHVYKIYSQLMAVLDIDDSARYQEHIEDVREMRFVLRKFLHAVTNLAGSGSSEKEAYMKAAHEAGDVESDKDGAENIGLCTGDILRSILENAPWGLEKGKAHEEQESNVSLKGLRDGIKATVDTLSTTLEEDATEKVEYEQGSPVQKTPKTPTKVRKPASAKSTPSRTPNQGPGNFNHGSARKWTDEENLETLRIVRDFEGSNAERTAEINRRMAAKANPPEGVRSQNAFRLQVSKLAETGVTIKSLEQALGLTGSDGDED